MNLGTGNGQLVCYNNYIRNVEDFQRYFVGGYGGKVSPSPGAGLIDRKRRSGT